MHLKLHISNTIDWLSIINSYINNKPNWSRFTSKVFDNEFTVQRNNPGFSGQVDLPVFNNTFFVCAIGYALHLCDSLLFRRTGLGTGVCKARASWKPTKCSCWNNTNSRQSSNISSRRLSWLSNAEQFKLNIVMFEMHFRMIYECLVVTFIIRSM